MMRDSNIGPGPEKLAAALHPTGFATLVRPGGRLLVARSLPPVPSQNSFWLRFRQPHWYLITWAPHVYRLPPDADVVETCIACMDASPTAMGRVPLQCQQRYQLKEVTGSAAYELAET